jgi:hypothetical protein
VECSLHYMAEVTPIFLQDLTFESLKVIQFADGIRANTSIVLGLIHIGVVTSIYDS